MAARHQALALRVSHSTARKSNHRQTSLIDGRLTDANGTLSHISYEPTTSFNRHSLIADAQAVEASIEAGRRRIFEEMAGPDFIANNPSFRHTTGRATASLPRPVEIPGYHTPPSPGWLLSDRWEALPSSPLEARVRCLLTNIGDRSRRAKQNLRRVVRRECQDMKQKAVELRAFGARWCRK